jgi:hypothetical protein
VRFKPTFDLIPVDGILPFSIIVPVRYSHQAAADGRAVAAQLRRSSPPS